MQVNKEETGKSALNCIANTFGLDSTREWELHFRKKCCCGISIRRRRAWTRKRNWKANGQ